MIYPMSRKSAYMAATARALAMCVIARSKILPKRLSRKRGKDILFLGMLATSIKICVLLPR